MGRSWLPQAGAARVSSRISQSMGLWGRPGRVKLGAATIATRGCICFGVGVHRSGEIHQSVESDWLRFYDRYTALIYIGSLGNISIDKLCCTLILIQIS